MTTTDTTWIRLRHESGEQRVLRRDDLPESTNTEIGTELTLSPPYVRDYRWTATIVGHHATHPEACAAMRRA